MIPKVIHYIWLGGKELPPIAKKCIASWQEFCPDYEIKRWDETNLDLDKYKFVQESLKAEKYAFASDVMRTDILYNHGGIYFDIDVELLKPIDNLLEHECFMGFESSKLIAPGLIMGSVAGNKDLAAILDRYKTLEFDKTNLMNITVCKVFTDYYAQFGLKQENTTQKINDTVFYSSEYFSPKNLTNGKITKTKNTYSIHHYNASWLSPYAKSQIKVRRIIARIIGEKCADKIKTTVNKIDDFIHGPK